jgi:cyclopropane fatty-acyl-phospholipid synthase-like methyltransferase
MIDLIEDSDEKCYLDYDNSIYEDALCYQPSRYEDLEEMVMYLKPTKNDVFVDFGCGKGRVVCYMALQDVRKVIGVELRKEYASVARRNIGLVKPPTPAEIQCCDAATFNSDEGTLFYMFNPFGSDTVREVIENIQRSLAAHPRQIGVIYNNPVYRNHLDRANWLAKPVRIGRTDIWVWRNL